MTLPQRNPHHPTNGAARGDPTRKLAEPIKALAFNTLLSSQETDTHRAGPASAFPAPGRLDLLYRIRPDCQFGASPIRLSNPACAAPSGRWSYFIRSGPIVKIELFPTHPDDAGATKPRQQVEDGSPGPAAVRRPALPWGEVNSMPKTSERQTGSHGPIAAALPGGRATRAPAPVLPRVLSGYTPLAPPRIRDQAADVSVRQRRPFGVAQALAWYPPTNRTPSAMTQVKAATASSTSRR